MNKNAAIRPWLVLRATWITIIGLLMCSVANAERSPATFGHAEASLTSLIEFPELRGDATVMLQCFAQVQGSGKMKETGCFLNNNGDQVFIAAIMKAAKKARLNPAQMDGKKMAVYVQFRVQFTKVGDAETVKIFNNPGLQENIDAYGEDHIAAQRAMTREVWQKTCPRRTRFVVWAKAHVAEDGQQSSFSVVPGDGPPITAKCRDGILTTLTESRFTPAMADGVAVPSSFIEPFGN